MAGDDLLLGAGIDLAGARRDTAALVREFQTAFGQIQRSATTTDLTPNLSTQAKRAAADVTQAAAQEKAARAQVRAELSGEIQTLALYGRTVNATNAKAVAAWRSEAAAIRKQAQEVNASRDQILRLDLAIQQTERRFAAMARAARLPNISGPIGTAANNLGVLNAQTGKFTALGNRAANTAVAVGFGLEGIARGGAAAEGGVRTALRSIASFAGFLGPKGLIVAGAAAGTASIISLFSRARDEMQETREQFIKEVQTMVKGVDAQGIVGQLKKIDLGSVTVDDDLNVKRIKGLKDLRAEVFALRQERDALDRGGFGNKEGFRRFTDIKKKLEELEPVLAQRQSDFDKLVAVMNALPTQNTFKQPEIIVTAKTEKAGDALKDLSEDVRVLLALSDLARQQTLQIPTLPESAAAIYDRVAEAVKRYGSGTDATAAQVNELAAQIRELDAVMIGLTRRKLGDTGVPDLGPLRVKGLIATYELAPTDQLVPLDASVRFNPTALSKGFTDALRAAATADNDVALAGFINNRNLLADASENAAIATANLRKEVEREARSILSSSASTEEKRAKLAAMRKEAADAGIDIDRLTSTINDSSRNVISLGERLNDVANIASSLANVADAIGGIDASVIDAIDSVGRLSSDLSRLTEFNTSLEQSGKGGIFSSLGNVFKALPLVGDVIASAADTYRKVFEALTGIEEDRANQAIRRENTEAIVRLSQDIAGFSTAVQSQNLTAANAIRDSAILQQRALTSGFSRGFKNVEALDKELRASGTSLADLKRRAEDLGIEIVDAKGRISAEGLVALDKALRLAVLGMARFHDTLEDFTFLADARADIFDIPDTAQSAFDEAIGVIQQFTSGLGDSLVGLNVTTAEERAKAEQEIRRLFDLAANNLLPPELLKGLTAEEFVQQLIAADNALDKFAETALKAAGEMVNVAQGFAVNRRVFEAIVNSSTTAGGGTIRTGAPPPKPTPTPIPAGTGSATTVTTVPLTVSLSIAPSAKTGAETYAEIRRTAIDRARTISSTAVAAVQAALPA